MRSGLRNAVGRVVADSHQVEDERTLAAAVGRDPALVLGRVVLVQSNGDRNVRDDRHPAVPELEAVDAGPVDAVAVQGLFDFAADQLVALLTNDRLPGFQKCRIGHWRTFRVAAFGTSRFKHRIRFL